MRVILVIEYATLGVLTALTGVLLAIGANYALAVFVFKASPWPDLMLIFSALGLVSFVSVLGGLVLSRGVCGHSPLEILRGGS